ncbi:hypothetical protein FUT88_02270 [Ralstonia sp. TCR112]|uniref:hypothetical protein n=1 Tax=Ralstonia sp. TCR112 TaxID=2601730 RepID=UPI0011BDB1AB|nr:hypothetical protein [Ralstonia sp. TCR112]TXD63492.1 hypothetical protein FUT88_02270 [Ralstonia sp. TCR112]
MDLRARRVEKLRQMVNDAGGPAAFARLHKGVNPTYVSQLLNGAAPFGDRAVEKMEKLIGLPAGTFDAGEADRDTQLAERDRVIAELRQQLAASRAREARAVKLLAEAASLLVDTEVLALDPAGSKSRRFEDAPAEVAEPADYGYPPLPKAKAHRKRAS